MELIATEMYSRFFLKAFVFNYNLDIMLSFSFIDQTLNPLYDFFFLTNESIKPDQAKTG